MAEFGGWLMPIEYPAGGDREIGGVIAEHHAVRERVGLFDVSHLGKISVKGKGALASLNSILTNDLNALSDGQAHYTLLCDSDGGVIDDMIAYRKSADEVFLIPNAANCGRVREVIQTGIADGIDVMDRHREYGIIAVQGPQSRELIREIGIDVTPTLPYMSFVASDFEGREIIVCRTGYTGELGFELVVDVSSGATASLWQRLVAALGSHGGAVAGLGARDTLRTEMGYALHGHELSPSINPLEAGVGWAVAFSKQEFIGRESLVRIKEAGVARKSIALLSTDKTIPRPNMSVTVDETSAGFVTSGTFSPTLKRGIALALIRSDLAKNDTYSINVRGRSGQYQRVKLPFHPSRVR